MSYHILHILSDNAYLSKKRGMLHYQNRESGEVKQMPVEDIRILVLAAKSITLTDSLIMSLLENEAVILHCDSKYMASGITSPLERVINPKAIYNQAQQNSPFSKELWGEILYTKVNNQQILLKIIGDNSTYLADQLEKNKKEGKTINESACARFYWRHYFDKLGETDATRRHSPDHKVNMMLNYSYAVLAAICQRSIVIHGLSPLFGIHHKARYKANSFVYDVMELLRPFVDITVYKYVYDISNNEGIKAVDEINLTDWIKSARLIGEEITVKHKNYRLKLVDSVDVYISSLANAFKNIEVKSVFLPRLDEESAFDAQKDLF